MKAWTQAISWLKLVLTYLRVLAMPNWSSNAPYAVLSYSCSQYRPSMRDKLYVHPRMSNEAAINHFPTHKISSYLWQNGVPSTCIHLCVGLQAGESQSSSCLIQSMCIYRRLFRIVMGIMGILVYCQVKCIARKVISCGYNVKKVGLQWSTQQLLNSVQEIVELERFAHRDDLTLLDLLAG